MLQRIQSVWLLLASVCSLLTMKFSFFTGTKVDASGGPVEVKLTRYLTATSSILLMILTVVVFVAGLVIIFYYKNRKLQLRLSLGLFLLSLINLLLFFRETKEYINGTYSLTAMFAFVVPVFFFLAARGIYRDQRMVKNADRLR